MQHDQAAPIQGPVQHRFRAANGHGPGIQGVPHHPPGQLRNPGDPGHRRHFVHRHGIVHEGRYTQRLRYVPGHHASQVGGVCPLGDGGQILDHVPVHRKGPAGARRQHTAPGAHCIQGGQIEARQRLLHAPAAERGLVHNGPEGGQLLSAVADRFLHQGRLPVKHGDLGGGGAGIDDQNAVIHGVSPPFAGETSPRCT